MGYPKALLPFGRTTFSRSIVRAFKRAGLRDVRVVVGCRPGSIVAHLCNEGIRFVMNLRWPIGQLSSLQAAIRDLPKSAAGILVALVDQPGLRASTIRRLLLEHQKYPNAILAASYQGKAGHPVVFPKKFFGELLRAPLSEGARVVVRKHIASRRLIPVRDPAVVRDIDTKKELRRTAPFFIRNAGRQK